MHKRTNTLPTSPFCVHFDFTGARCEAPHLRRGHEEGQRRQLSLLHPHGQVSALLKGGGEGRGAVASNRGHLAATSCAARQRLCIGWHRGAKLPAGGWRTASAARRCSQEQRDASEAACRGEVVQAAVAWQVVWVIGWLLAGVARIGCSFRLDRDPSRQPARSRRCAAADAPASSFGSDVCIDLALLRHGRGGGRGACTPHLGKPCEEPGHTPLDDMRRRTLPHAVHSTF